MYVFQIDPGIVRDRGYKIEECAAVMSGFRSEVSQVWGSLSDMSGMGDVLASLDKLMGDMLSEHDGLAASGQASVNIADCFDDTEDSVIDNIDMADKKRRFAKMLIPADTPDRLLRLVGPGGQAKIDYRVLDELASLIVTDQALRG